MKYFFKFLFCFHKWTRVSCNIHGDTGIVTIFFSQCEKCGRSHITYQWFTPYSPDKK